MTQSYSIRQYTPADKSLWNDFVKKSKNATFLFNRNFIEYHSDRFDDASQLIYKKNTLFACLPANRVANELFSHQGLTYGGLLLTPRARLEEVVEVMQQLLIHLQQLGIDYLYLKQLPVFYATQPAQELHYILFLLKAELYRIDTASVIDYRHRVPIKSNRMEGVKRGGKVGLKVVKEASFEAFWQELLLPHLAERHHTQPTHSLEEITQLKRHFPEHILQFNCYDYNEQLIAGATIFETRTTAHVQYIASGKERQETGALDFLFYTLINDYFNHKAYFDFGTSNEKEGRKVNGGLSYWKSSFGASTYTHPFYRIQTNQYPLLKDVLL